MSLEIKAQILFNLFYNIIQVGVRTTKWHIILMFLIIITKLMMEFYDAKFMEIKKTNNGTIRTLASYLNFKKNCVNFI